MHVRPPRAPADILSDSDPERREMIEIVDCHEKSTRQRRTISPRRRG